MTPQNISQVSLLLLSLAAFSLANAHDANRNSTGNTVSETVGPVVGSVQSTTAHLLYRPDGKPHQLRLSVLSQDGKLVSTADSSCQSKNDFVAKFTVEGLQPGTTYRYQIDALDNTEATLIQANDDHAFTTAKTSRTDASVTVGFVSCVDIEPSEIWREMESLGVDAVCLMGDTPYIDDSNLAVVRQRHRAFLQMPELAAMATHTPVIGTWDDHDFGLNNGNGLSMLDGKINTRKGFVDYRAHNQYGNGKEGVYHKIDLGMMEIFLLDPRYFSQTQVSPVDPSQTTCFGAKQWQWLLDGLKESKAPFKVLAIGAIWQDKKNKETDDMFTYWYERDALLDFIAAESITGVTLLGGDIHLARHLIHPRRVGYDLHDFIISPGHTRTITKLDVYHPSLEWSLIEGWQFLTLTADGTTGSPRLIAEYRQPDDVVNRRVEIPMIELTPPPSESGLQKDLRAVWGFDDGLRNASALGQRIDAEAHNGATVHAGAGIHGGAVRFQRDEQQFLIVPRSFLDDNSDTHTVSLWFKPESLPAHGSDERQFVIESTAEGTPSNQPAWHLSLGLRAAADATQVNLQLYTHTLEPAPRQAAPAPISQGPFDFLVDRDDLTEAWTQATVTFDSQTIDLYLNGELVSPNPLPTPGPASEFGGIVIGGHRNGVGRNFDGWIDEVAIWQRVLSEDEIRTAFTQARIPAK